MNEKLNLNVKEVTNPYNIEMLQDPCQLKNCRGKIVHNMPIASAKKDQRSHSDYWQLMKNSCF